jgi:nucleotide-binding universal stress UspA family protein
MKTLDDGARKILVAISQSQESRAALAGALMMARASGGECFLLHAVELNIAGEEHGIAREKLLCELMGAAEWRLTDLARAWCAEVPFTVVVAEGPPADTILRTAQALGADAIVMGPRRSEGFKWLRRDHARRVEREAPCPVHIVNGADTLPVGAGRPVNAKELSGTGEKPPPRPFAAA